MAAWWPTVGVGLVTALLFLLPGLPVAFAAGMRGIAAWASATLFSVAIIASTAIIAPMLGGHWSAWPVVVAIVLWTGLARWIRHMSGHWRSPGFRSRTLRRRMLLGVGPIAVIGSGGYLFRLMRSIGGPTQVAQSADTSYHLNSIAHILQTHDGSSLHMTLATPGTSSNFYPAAWHDIASLVVQLTGTPIPTAALWVSMLSAALIWPLSLLACARVLFGPRPIYLAATAIVGLLMYQFPMMLFQYGVLYPNLLSEAMVPTLIAVLMLALTRAHGRGRLAPAFIAVSGAIAIALTEPNGVVASVYIMLPFVFAMALRARRNARLAGAGRLRSMRPVLFLLAGIAATWAVTELIPLVRNFRALHLSGKLPLPTAVGRTLVLSAGHPGNSANWLVVACALIGLVVCVRIRRWRWLPFSLGIFAVLFILSVGIPNRIVHTPGISWFQSQLVGYWYFAWERLAAALPLTVVPIAAIGVATVARFVAVIAAQIRGVGPAQRVWRVVSSPSAAIALTKPIAVGLVVVGAAATTGFTFVQPVSGGFTQTHRVYSFATWPGQVPCTQASPTFSCSPNGALVDSSELAFMSTVQRIVPANYAIAGNPYDGSALMWALMDRVTLFPVQGMKLTGDYALIGGYLWQAATNPWVCQSVRNLHVGYVLLFNSSELWGTFHAEFSGIYITASENVGKLVARSGSMQLWQITACGDIPPLP